MRTVHRFEEVLLTLFRRMDRLERILTVFGIVSGSDIEQFVADRRTHYFLIVVTGLNAAQELLQTDTQCGALRQPHRQTLTYRIGEHEQVHFLADFTVVAFLGLFQQYEIFIQHFLFRESDAVDTGHHFAVFLSAPVCAGNGSQFDGFDRCGSHQVRTTAQVGKRALRIGGDVTVFQLRNQLAFISFATVAEHLQSVCL